MDLLTLTFILFLFLRQFTLLFRRQILTLFLCLFYGLRLRNNGLDIFVQTAEAFNFHECIHGLLICHQARQRVVIHIDEQRAFPAFGQQSSRCTCHSHIKNLACAYLLHGHAVISYDRQEADELTDLAFRVTPLYIETATVIGYLAKGAIKSEVENIALFLDDFLLSSIR